MDSVRSIFPIQSCLGAVSGLTMGDDLWENILHLVHNSCVCAQYGLKLYRDFTILTTDCLKFTPVFVGMSN